MKSRLLLIALLAALLMLIVVVAPIAADDLIAVDEEGATISGESPPGIEAVSWRYDFASSAGTYTEILTGTVHGTASNDDTSFNAVDIGFTFTYDGVDYTQVSIQSNGFIAMGPTVSSSYTPISTGSSNNVIAALARDLQGNGTTSALWSATEGTAPDRIFIVQWKDYKRYGSSYLGDDFDFQIRLYETSNVVEVMYGNVMPLAGSAAATVQVGLRGASNADYNNRMTDATHDWSDSLAGTSNAATMGLSDTLYPASGLTYDWSLYVGVTLIPEAQGGNACPGSDVVYEFEVANTTGMPQSFNISYASVWPVTGPSTTGVIPNDGSVIIQVSVHIPWAANAGDSDVLTVTAADATGAYVDTATATTTAATYSGYADYANVPIGREVRAPSVVYWDGKLYKIGGYGYVSGTGAARAWLDIYDIATDTWSSGADMPGARYWIDCEAIAGKIYCAGGYLSSGQTNLYIYDIATNGWSEGAALAAYRYNYASVQLGGKYYLIGGYAAGYTATMIVYDPATNTWDSTLASMNTARRYFHAGVIGGKIYVAGGYNGSYLASAEVYDPATDMWTYIADMPSPWVNAADGVVYDRYLLLTGGTYGSTSGASNGALFYDAVTNTWDWLPLLDRLLYSAEGDGDGTSYWTVSGRMYENATWSNSPYTTLLTECGECVPVTTADFSFDPPAPRPTMPVVFSGWADGSPPFAFDWDFGDGGSGAGQVYTHTYAAPDTYTVVMTATNCDGASSATATHDVLVEAGPTIVVDPLSFESTQCPDCLMTYTLSICNIGDQPLLYTFTESLDWLSEDPTGGTVAAGSCDDADVIFDSTGLMADTYTGTLLVESNDTMNPVVDVDVSLTVAGGPTNAAFTYDPAQPWAGEVVTFNGTADALLPIDYTWDFGDGTTGAGQNITHIFAAAGDYTVTMTATVCGESAVVTHVVSVPTCWSVLDEHFEGTFPPVDWTVINNGGNCVWQRNDYFATPRPNYAGGDGFCADADSDRCGSGTTMDTELRTMVLDLTGMTTATLEYVSAYNDIGTGGDLADVDVSIDGGATWTNLLQWDEDHSAYGPGELVNLDLTPYAGQASVMVRFHYYVATYDWWWEVDQVNVGGCYIEGAAPEIVVTPTELEQTLYPDQAADQTFNIANIGLVALDWTLDEGCGTPVDWLSLDPLAGTTPVGGGTDVTVSFDSTGLAVGTYQAPVCVNSNDPVSPTVIVDVTLIVTGAPEIAVTPPALDSSQMPDVQVTLPLTVCNVGEAPLTWSLFESNPVLRLLAAPGAGMPAPAAEYPVITSEAQCADYENSTGLEPIGWAEFCTDGFVPPAPAQPGTLAPTDIGFAQDIGYISDNFVTFVLNNWPGQTVIGTSTNAYYGMDFDPSATILYALNDTTDELGVIDLATGAFTGLVSCPPGGGAANWTGLTIDPVNGTFYGSTSTNLYLIDPATGSSTLIGAFNTGGLIIDIAINAVGEMYGHDIGTDSIYSIDPATGAATLIGPTGYAGNYAQGMDFDNDDGTLYIFLYTGSGTNVFGTVNLATGAVTPLAVSDPLGEFEGAIQTAGLVDIPWLSEDPLTGTLDAGLCEVLDVTFDSTGLALSDYFAGLRFESNDPYIPEVYVPVTLTVGIPDITVEPQSLATELCPEATDVLTFTICNTGTVPLEWMLSEGEAMAPFLGATSFTFQAPRGVVDVPDLDLSAPGVEGTPSTPVSPEDVLWEQPSNLVGAPASQYFPDFGAGLWSADDFDTNGEYWAIESIYVPGSLWNGNPQGDLYDAESLNWFIYADAGNMPPSGVYPDDGSGTEVWSLSLPPTHPAVTIGGATNNEATLDHTVLGGPLVLEPGHYWLVFFPAMNFVPHGQFGWQTSGTTNLASAHFADPDGLISPLDWTPWGVAINPTYYDAAFRIEGYVTEPAVDIPWLSENPTGGMVLPGLCQTVEVTFTAPITPGDYFANLLVQSNDPDTPEITIPVTMTVLEPAAIVSVTYTVNDLEVTFDATATGEEPLAYAWDFGDDNTSDLEDPVHVYAEGGCYTVTLTVMNACGEATWSEEICVCEPVSGLDFSWLPETPVVDEEVTFTASAMGTEPIVFAWDFGDDATGTGITATHAYAEAGDYVVTVTATNCDGASEVMTHTITVETGMIYYYQYLPIIVKNNG